MSKTDDFIKGLATLLECDAQKVVSEANLEEIGTWDSVTVMMVMALIDEVYGKVADGRALSQCVEVGDVIKLAEAA